MARGEQLTNEQWALIEPLLAELPKRDDSKGILGATMAKL